MIKLTDSQTRLVVSAIGVFVIISFIGFTASNLLVNRRSKEAADLAKENNVIIAETAEATAKEINARFAKSDNEIRKQIDSMFTIATEAVSDADAVFKVDKKGIITYMNSVASSEFPLLNVGGPLDEMLQKDMREKHEEAMEKSFERTLSPYSVRLLQCSPITKTGPRPAIIKTWTNENEGALAVIKFLEKRANNGHTEPDQN